MKTLLTAGLTFGGCTAARWFLDRESRRDETIAGGHVRLTKLWNKEGAFGWKANRNTILLLSVTDLGTVWLCRKQAPIAAGLVLGGGLSNFSERLRHRKVYDYIRFPKAPGKLKTYVFNLADLALFSGLAGLLLRRR